MQPSSYAFAIFLALLFANKIQSLAISHPHAIDAKAIKLRKRAATCVKRSSSETTTSTVTSVTASSSSFDYEKWLSEKLNAAATTTVTTT